MVIIIIHGINYFIIKIDIFFTMYFVERLIQRIKEKQSVICMGLDPRMDNRGEIPQYLINQYEDSNTIILEFNKQLIESCHELIPIVKPQIAFYEKYDALKALKETIKYAHKHDLEVILDSKRNDIGTTSAAYAYSTFNIYGADACTLNGYLGYDSIKPYIDGYKEKGLFVLVKTSNPSSNEFQNLFSVRIDKINGPETSIKIENIELERNYVHMAKLVRKWSENLNIFSNYHNLGIVVGATFPNELKSIRELLKHSFILIPGYGHQGAHAKDIKSGFFSDGLGGIVNAARSIIYAYHKNPKFSPEKFAFAAREEIIQMNKNINREINL
ncbi:MAG: orotidine-5'-phosphate decarboxylase [Promethearchaeota archaeon]|nr:MAG: orotidine-5'-phosphate decarboxylase [Candidatus Lokiarchaeota archaeon]